MGRVPRRGWREDLKKARPSFSGLRLPPNCLCPGLSPPAPEETQGDDPSDSRGRRKGCGGSRYLPVPQVRDHRAGRSTTLGNISSGAKQAFIAALAARLRRRAAQRIPRLKGIVVLLPGAAGWTRGKGLYFPEALWTPWGRCGQLLSTALLALHHPSQEFCDPGCSLC